MMKLGSIVAEVGIKSESGQFKPCQIYETSDLNKMNFSQTKNPEESK
jgi:hypothetical protein